MDDGRYAAIEPWIDVPVPSAAARLVAEAGPRAPDEEAMEQVRLAPLGARFDLERRLKEGNGVETYAGTDTVDGSPV
ncbi:MAG TPA: hypothetical protein VKX24_09550, partial [Acidimicrobiia bacterium]|nr:hypothetical protein [Acidimicrobiia bacterium]